MQLAELVVEGLFGKYDHKISLPTNSDDDAEPSVVIVHGPNGVGKTTMLKMLSGMMALDFTMFRLVPFRHAHLDFTGDQRLSVDRRDDGILEVTFDGLTALLASDHAGPWRDKDSAAVEVFREAFYAATKTIKYEYLGANRIQPDATHGSLDPVELEHALRLGGEYDASLSMTAKRRAEQRARHFAAGNQPAELAGQVKKFISDAQLDHAAFFRSRDPDLFLRIIGDLTSKSSGRVKVEEIRESFTKVHELDGLHARLGLGRDEWDFEQVMTILAPSAVADLDDHALAVIGTYAEFIESRAANRQLVAERLVTFEKVMAEFLTGKDVRVDARKGITIISADGSRLDESQLSSGEYQLLYLMVSALTTKRRGTVIAIDEPELSMHIAWQRRLVPSLVKCASRAAPQLLLATHSPEIAAGYPESMVELGAV